MRWWHLAGAMLLLIAPVAAEEAKAVPTAAVWGGKAMLLEGPSQGDATERFNGSVEWRTGRDANGAMTLVGTIRIPPRALGIDFAIGPNTDDSLPASHIVEVRFLLGHRFPATAITAMPGIMFKDQWNSRGTPLAGASARVADDTFLFALASTDADLARNMTLLGERSFIDIAMVYADGKRGIVTVGLGGAKAAFAAFSAAALK